MSVGVMHHQFTVDEYYKLYDAGVFTDDDRVELIEGEIIHMPPIGPRHAACVDRINRLFAASLSEQTIVRIQNPARLSRITEPLPDVVLMKLRDDFYVHKHPEPEDVLLIVEVADTTLKYDKNVKLPIYARSGIREVWIVNINDDVVEVYRSPSASGYQKSSLFKRGQRLSPEFFSDALFTVDEILC